MAELEPWRWVVVDPDTGIDLYTDGAKARDRAGGGVVAFPVYRSSSYGGNPAAVRELVEAAREYYGWHGDEYWSERLEKALAKFPEVTT